MDCLGRSVLEVKDMFQQSSCVNTGAHVICQTELSMLPEHGREVREKGGQSSLKRKCPDVLKHFTDLNKKTYFTFISYRLKSFSRDLFKWKNV